MQEATLQATFEIMDAPLCGKDTVWLRSFVETKIDGLKPLLDNACLLEPQHAFHILRHCVNAKLNYLCQSVPCHIAKEFAEQAEELIWSTVCKILAVPEDQPERVRIGFDVVLLNRSQPSPAHSVSAGGYGGVLGLTVPAEIHLSRVFRVYRPPCWG